MGVNGYRAVTVFGSSRVLEGSAEYEEALRLGRLLAESGFTVFNGGYEGTMEATARGAKEGLGHTVGCTVDLLAARDPNRWIDEEQRSVSLLNRLDSLTRSADGFVVLRGGVGTLLELALVWNLAQLDHEAKQPIVLVGQAWLRVLDALARELHVRPEDLARVHAVDTVELAVDKLRDVLAVPAMPAVTTGKVLA